MIKPSSNYLAKTGCIDRLHTVFVTKIDIVEVDNVAGYANSVGQLVVGLQPTERGGGGMGSQLAPKVDLGQVEMVVVSNATARWRRSCTPTPADFAAQKIVHSRS